MDDKPNQDEALDTIPVAPPEPDPADTGPAPNAAPDAGTNADKENGRLPEVREALDAGSHEALARDPGHEDAKLDIGLDESFPNSDPPANTAPGHNEPAPSSGYDEEAEKAR